MYSKNNKIIQAKVDVASKYFLANFSKQMDCTVAELTGAIIRKFIFEYGHGSNEYSLLPDFIVKNQNLKECRNNDLHKEK